MASDADSSSPTLEQRLTDEQLQRLIMRAYEDSPDMAQLQLSMRGVMLADPERIRQAYMRVVQLKGGARSRAASEQQQTPRPSLTLLEPGGASGGGAGSGKRTSQRRRSNPAQQRGGHRKSGGGDAAALSALMDTSGLKEVAGSLDTLRSELAALCRVRHQNLLCLIAARPGKAGRITLDFDLAGATSQVTLLELLREPEAGAKGLNACEIACVLAQACLGLLFLTECAAGVLRNLQVHPEACLLTRNMLLTNRGLVKLCGHHPVLQLPRASTPTRAVPPNSVFYEGFDSELDDFLDSDSDSGRARPGQLAHRLAQLLYELDHAEHRPLRCLAECPWAERELLDQRYARLFSLCSDWDASKPVDLRCVLYSNFINEQTSSIDSYQMPLEFVFATKTNF